MLIVSPFRVEENKTKGGEGEKKGNRRPKKWEGGGKKGEKKSCCPYFQCAPIKGCLRKRERRKKGKKRRKRS